MNNKEIYQYLTPAAKEELANKINEFESKVVSKAYKSATRNQEDIKEISLSDILKATSEPELRIKTSKSLKYNLYKKERFYKLISLTGILYAIIGIGIYLYQSDLINLKASSGLIITIVGIVFAIAGLVLKSSFTSKSRISYLEEHSQLAGKYDIVDRWQKLENLALDRVEINEKRGKISSVINFYRSILSEQDFLEFRKMLDIRNRILHENYRPSNSTYKRIIDLSERLLDRVEKIEPKNTMANNV